MGGFESVEATTRQLAAQGYIADDDLSVALFLSLRMQRPLFLEGAPGVGKTELAKAVAAALGTELIRLQCYEGLDLSQAAYEWNYLRQLLEIQAGRRDDGSAGGSERLFTPAFLLKRPLLDAIDPARTTAPVLLIDEIDRADEEFESFLLELLSEFQISIPELGTIRATHRPQVFLTSNRTREVHEALKRRCLYHFVDYPPLDKEIEIVRRRVPGLAAAMRARVVAIIRELRQAGLAKAPGVAETLDWAEGLQALGAEDLDGPTLDRTLGLFLKVREDIERVRDDLASGLLDLGRSEP